MMPRVASRAGVEDADSGAGKLFANQMTVPEKLRAEGIRQQVTGGASKAKPGNMQKFSWLNFEWVTRINRIASLLPPLRGMH